MVCSETHCNNGIDYQCAYCQSDFCREHINRHSLCEIDLLEEDT